MFVHDLNCQWVDHGFMQKQVEIKNESLLYQVRAIKNLSHLYIDTSRGCDVIAEANADAPAVSGPDAQSREAVAHEENTSERAEDAPSGSPAQKVAPSSYEEEVVHAKKLFDEGSHLVRDLMQDIRLGKQIEIERCTPCVEGIMESVLRYPSVFLPLVQVKSANEYTFQHSVAAAALAVAFGQILEMPQEVIKELALGGLLHDVGKARVPGRILNKPGKLDEDEYAIIKTHVEHTADILKDIPGLSPIAFNAAAQHHERYDGSGYPQGLVGEQISLYGQIMSIVDVYDAITSVRIYRKGIHAHEAMGRIFEWGSNQFNKWLSQAFIKGIGIYPVGSLIRLEGEILGIVRKNLPNNVLQPIVQIMYDCKRQRQITPRIIDLSATGGKIVSHESYEKWGINRANWIH